MSESFAAAGSVVVLLVWVYYAAQIFLFGAEFTKVFAQDHGSRAGGGAKTERAVAVAETSEPSRLATKTAGGARLANADSGRTAVFDNAVGAQLDHVVPRALATKASKSAGNAWVKLYAELAVLATVKIASMVVNQRRQRLQKRHGWKLR